MECLFTTSGVLLAEEFVRSCPKKALWSKLSKLRLVTGIQFSKANKTYALAGEWNQIDAAFEILTHWQTHPDHEPNTKDAESGKIASLCNCNIASPYEGWQAQSESESRPTQRFDFNVEQLQKEYSELNECLNKSNSNVNENTSKNKTVNKPVINNKDKINQNAKLKYDNSPNQNATELNKTAHNKQQNKKNEVITQKTDIDTNTNKSKVNNFGESSENESYTMVHVKVEIKEENDADEQNESQVGRNKNLRKPGDKGYWSRLKRKDAHLAHQCPKCSVVLKSRKRYQEHMRRIHIKEYMCDACGKGFGYPTDLNRHKCPSKIVNVKDTEDENTEFPCTECEFVAISKKRLGIHMKRTHLLEHHCDKCDKRFGYKKDLEKHFDSAHNLNVFFCDQCSKLYRNKQVFDLHMKTHGEDYVKPKFMCEKCSKSFSSKSYLTNHIKNEHLGLKKTYLCQVCGKNFSTRNSYKQHCNAHNNIKPYKCDICDKAFVYHKSLREHQFMHENIRRFVCTVCDKAFRQRTCLHIHMKTHKRVKDHVCPTCGRGFSQKQAMQRHERIHSGIRPYTCMICKKAFGDTSTVRRHMISLHAKTERNWKEDVHSTLPAPNDYYVFGGTGQNRSFVANPTATQTEPKDDPPSSTAVKLENLEESEPGLVVRTPIQTSSYCVSSESNNENIQSIQPRTIYTMAPTPDVIPTSAQEQLSVQNNLGQVLDFSNITFIATKLPQQSIDKHQTGEQNLQQPLPVQVQTPSGMLQTAKILPLSAVSDSDSFKLCGPNTSIPMTADSALSQAIGSFWGLVGYPSYQSQGTLQVYQPPQN